MPRVSTSTTTCARSTSSARACRPGSSSGSSAPSPTTAIDGLDRQRRARGRAAADLRRPAATSTSRLAVVAGDAREPRSPADAGRSPTACARRLDRVIEATQRRYPAVASLARGVRHRLFDRPLIDRARDEVAAAMRGHVARHARSPVTEPTVAAAHEERSSPARCRSCRCSPAGGLFATTDRPGAAARGADAPLLQDPRARVR